MTLVKTTILLLLLLLSSDWLVVVDCFTATRTRTTTTTTWSPHCHPHPSYESSSSTNNNCRFQGHLFATTTTASNDGGSISSSSSTNADVDELRKAAQRLRQDAEDLQAELLMTSTTRTSSSTDQKTTTWMEPPTYTSFKDSTWTFTYRFASEPEKDEKDKKKQQQQQRRMFYTGKLQVTFLSDGYTKLVMHEPTGSSTVEMDKIWGWDEEISEEEDTYILFSSTTMTPSDDPIHPKESLRFYWQGRVSEKDGKLSITDGTITVKKNVEPPGGGFWGVFDGGGILAQFRYVGDFVAKPSRPPSDGD